MFTIANYPYENCTKKCKNSEHGDRINRVLVNESISDERLAAYIAKTCKNFARVQDHQVIISFCLGRPRVRFNVKISVSVKGQSALHVAASLDKYAIVEWLLHNVSSMKASLAMLGEKFNRFIIPIRMLKSIWLTNKTVTRHSIELYAVVISILPFCWWIMVRHWPQTIGNSNRLCNIAANQRTMWTHSRTSKQSRFAVEFLILNFVFFQNWIFVVADINRRRFWFGATIATTIWVWRIAKANRIHIIWTFSPSKISRFNVWVWVDIIVCTSMTKVNCMRWAWAMVNDWVRVMRIHCFCRNVFISRIDGKMNASPAYRRLGIIQSYEPATIGWEWECFLKVISGVNFQFWIFNRFSHADWMPKDKLVNPITVTNRWSFGKLKLCKQLMCDLIAMSYSHQLIPFSSFDSDKGFRGVLAREYHSLAYTGDSIYACGLNVGQFGLAADETKLSQPKKVRMRLNGYTNSDLIWFPVEHIFAFNRSGWLKWCGHCMCHCVRINSVVCQIQSENDTKAHRSRTNQTHCCDWWRTNQCGHHNQM